MRINRHKATGRGRIVMRMKGVLKVLLNTPIFPSCNYEKVGQKSVKFVGVDIDGGGGEAPKGETPNAARLAPGSRLAPTGDAPGLCAYRLNLLSSDQQGRFMRVLQGLLLEEEACQR